MEGGGIFGMGRLLDFRIPVNCCEVSIMKTTVCVCVCVCMCVCVQTGGTVAAVGCEMSPVRQTLGNKSPSNIQK